MNTKKTRVTNYFDIGDLILLGKYKSSKGKIVGFGEDKWGNPTVEIEPVPKGRKKNKIIGLFKIWRADVKDQTTEVDDPPKSRVKK